MAVGFDAKMTAGNSSDGFNQEAIGATSVSSTGMTIGGAASLLVAMLAFGAGGGTAPTSLSMTWNGVTLTAQAFVVSSGGGAMAAVYLFTLVNPATGNRTLAGAWTTAQDCYMSCISFTGTDTVTGVAVADNTTTSQVTTITVPSTVDGATVAVFAVDGSTPTVNFTKIWAEAPNNPGGGASYTLGGTSNAHTFTGGGGTRQALAGVHVIAASGGGSSVTYPELERGTNRGSNRGRNTGIARSFVRRDRIFVPAYAVVGELREAA